MFPQYWKKFIQAYSLEHKEIEFPWPNEDDLDCVIQVMSESEAIDEATNYWPGIGVKKDGYIPVGHCAIGTGDPYFINTNDGENGPLYKIDHEAVSEDGYNKEEAVDVMLSSYSEITKYENT